MMTRAQLRARLWGDTPPSTVHSPRVTMPEEKPKKRRSRSGKHANALRTVSGIADDRWEAYAAHAAALGISRAEWIRAALEEALSRQRTRLKKSTAPA